MAISFPFKRVFALLGAPRVGKDEVANFLSETRNFQQIAFADQIKEEFGISNADFEASKIAGNIKELRDRLWAFSADKKKEDPDYFIRKVIDKAQKLEESVVITDIRTEDEFNAFINSDFGCLKRIYWVRGDFLEEEDENGYLAGSRLHMEVVLDICKENECDIRIINNRDKSGLYKLYRKLDKRFFGQDVEDMCRSAKDVDIWEYMDQFEVKQKGE